MTIQKRLPLLGVVALSLFLTGCKQSYTGEADADFETKYVDPSTVTLPDDDYHTSLQYAYLTSTYDTIEKFAAGTEELSKSTSKTLNWSKDGLAQAETYYVQLAEDSSFTDPLVYSVSRSYSVSLKNFKIGTNYYWRVSDSASNYSSSTVHQFTTSDTKIRNLSVDGVTNVRDIGGYSSKLGGKVKQGLYYRGGRLNTGSGDTIELNVTKSGLKTLTEELKIKTEIDLRMNLATNKENEIASMDNTAIPEINYINIPIDYNVSDMALSAKKEIGSVFKLLSDSNNYPVYLHCSIGTDRTGLVSYLLGTLLGVDNFDLYKDYLFSNFGKIGSNRTVSKIKEYQKDLRSYGGTSLSDCAALYLKDCGVSTEQITSIQDFFLQK